MIQEAYCSYKVARLLKEKGFDELCNKKYNGNKNIVSAGKMIELWQNSEFDNDEECSAPTHQMVMGWLREVKHLHIVITIDGSQELKDKWLDERGIMIADCVCLYDFSIYNTKTGECRYSNSSMFDSLGYLTYGEAVDEAIKYCLENLI